MAEKKKKKASEPGWDRIGSMVGKKIAKEIEKSESASWSKWAGCHEDSGTGFLGRTLFIIGVLVALNMTGAVAGVNIWIQVLIGIGFALMKLS